MNEERVKIIREEEEDESMDFVKGGLFLLVLLVIIYVLIKVYVGLK